jgi:hypothetical protein
MITRLVRRLRAATGALLIAAGALLPGAAQAWKPTTHVELAEIALQDALDDGRVTLMRVDPRTGAIAGVLGEFAVAPNILAALRAAPDRYRAGVLGPDAYPDILTGQQIIHPAVARDESGAISGSDAWLTHLWDRSYGADASPEVRAFVSGFLTHAAGDAFAHTYVNHFSGGAFTLDPRQNAIRHVVLEGYLDKRAPEAPRNLAVSIRGVDGFIHDEMIAARPGTALEQRLLLVDEAAGRLSVPATFFRLRNRLQAEVDAGQDSLPTRLYKRAWIEDIDRGLRAWPAVSAAVSDKLLYGGEGADVEGATEILSDYARDHLWSMAGAPDWAVSVAYAPSEIARAVLPQALIDALGALLQKPLDAMIEAATGLTPDEWRDYILRPDRYFDAVMNDASVQPNGHAVSLADFNRRELGLSDPSYTDPSQRWTVDGFAPAFNTVQLTKLSFLDAQGLAAVERALGVPASGHGGNGMLGWLGSLDDSSQWRGAPPFGRAATFNQLFRPHFGAP